MQNDEQQSESKLGECDLVINWHEDAVTLNCEDRLE
jgi:hypothetical protein